MWEALKNSTKIQSFSKFFGKLVFVYHTVDFISEIIGMFGFIGKFKDEVVAGFDAVHQRLVTLEAKVEALFEHTKTVAEQEAKAEVAPAVAEVDKVETVATDAAATVEAAKSAE